ncbi:MAG: hypothetical protein E6G61_08480 [Actinobacteria bacterium]|nr:MAG: hypothetical protein E6G61_08480 [Actinomycetota bacterium]
MERRDRDLHVPAPPRSVDLLLRHVRGGVLPGEGGSRDGGAVPRRGARRPERDRSSVALYPSGGQAGRAQDAPGSDRGGRAPPRRVSGSSRVAGCERRDPPTQGRARGRRRPSAPPSQPGRRHDRRGAPAVDARRGTAGPGDRGRGARDRRPPRLARRSLRAPAGDGDRGARCGASRSVERRGGCPRPPRGRAERLRTPGDAARGRPHPRGARPRGAEGRSRRRRTRGEGGARDLRASRSGSGGRRSGRDRAGGGRPSPDRTEGRAEISARLYISTKTAGNHVSNLLAKLHLRSRQEAAAYAVRSAGERGT